MNVTLKSLSKYSRIDKEKQQMVDEALAPVQGVLTSEICEKKILREDDRSEMYADMDIRKEMILEDYCKPQHIEKVNASESPVFKSLKKKKTKYCPKCGRKYPERENVCMDCLVHLKNISDQINVRDIEYVPQITFEGANDFESFEEILTPDNLKKIHDFDFKYDDLSDITFNIKSQAFRNFDELVKGNDLLFDSLPILDKVILFAKSFVTVDFKSYGSQLGFYEKNTICIDDRQTKTLQITSVIHELSHFMIKEILTEILCRLLDASKNKYIEYLAEYILNNSYFTQLIDEYAAHDVEGRFTVFGYQDYSSFKQIELSLKDEIGAEEVEITKSIGNNFALEIKDILESFIDRDLREEIREQFMRDVLDDPNYRELMMENCKVLTKKSFLKGIWLILNEGCQTALMDIEQLNRKEL